MTHETDTHHRPVFLFARVLLVAIASFAFSVAPTPRPNAYALEDPATPTQPSFTPTSRIEDDDPRVVFTGGWRFASTTAASGATRRLATAAGAVALARFSGTGVSLVSRTSSDGGRVEISLDGSLTASVELTSTDIVEKARVWTASGLVPGVHTLTVRAVETSPAAEWHPVAVDAFEIEGSPLQAPAPATRRRFEEADRRIRFLGHWRNRVDLASASGKHVGTARSAGAKAIVSFTGTSITWLAPNQASRARAQLILDGRSYGYVNLQRPGSRNARRVMWSASGLKPGRHTLVVRAATGATSGSAVTLDTFEIDGSLLEARPASSLGYPWSRYIVVDKSDFRLYLVDDGLVVRTYPVAHGRVGLRTPSAVWRVDMKYFTSPSSVSGPRKMRLFRRVSGRYGYRYAFTAYGIHGTNQPWVIGTLASHGCIRLYNDDALDLFPRVPLGTMVVTRD